jgi:hypothetical protein
MPTATTVRRVALIAYAIVLGWWSGKYGVPIGRDYIFTWAFIGLAVASIGKSWRSIRDLIVDWTPFLLVVVAYDFSRGWADDLGISVNYTPQLNADKLLFFGHVPTEWLQLHLYHPALEHGFVHGLPAVRAQPTVPLQWFEVVFDLLYMSHYLAAFVLAAVLWVKNRRHFQAFARRFTTLSAFGFLTYALFPAAPPWLAARDGYLNPLVGRFGGRGFSWMQLRTIRTMIDAGAANSNLVAAVPSLHAGFATLVAITLWTRVPRWIRPLVAAYPVLMGFMLVANGEHYAVDILLGAAYAFAAHLLWNRIEPWWTRRKQSTESGATSTTAASATEAAVVGA